MVTRPKDAYDREISEQAEQYLQTTTLNTENPVNIFRNFQINRELRNAAAAARKALSKEYSAQYLTLIEKRLRRRGLSDEAIDTALLTVKKSLRR